MGRKGVRRDTDNWKKLRVGEHEGEDKVPLRNGS